MTKSVSQKDIYERVQLIKKQGKTRVRNGRRYKIVTIYSGGHGDSDRQLANHDARRIARAGAGTKTLVVKTKWGCELWAS